jgi:hypothetical protein
VRLYENADRLVVSFRPRTLHPAVVDDAVAFGLGLVRGPTRGRLMSQLNASEQLNSRGNELRDAGDIAGAERAYRAAASAAPDWSAPLYNLGLLYKYEGRWRESLVCNQQAATIVADDEATWWNLGIAATALGDWNEARRAWSACGIEIPFGEGAPECNFGKAPIRLDPNGAGEVVWARRLDPARARIGNVPLPTSTFRWGDVVLTDGAPAGQRVFNGRTYPVFDVLSLLVPSGFRTFVIELATSQPEALEALEQCADTRDAAVEDWGSSTRILCAQCSRGTPHEHTESSNHPANPHWGLAARDQRHAKEIITAWLDTASGSDLIKWYEAPTVPCEE